MGDLEEDIAERVRVVANVALAGGMGLGLALVPDTSVAGNTAEVEVQDERRHTSLKRNSGRVDNGRVAEHHLDLCCFAPAAAGCGVARLDIRRLRFARSATTRSLRSGPAPPLSGICKYDWPCWRAPNHTPRRAKAQQKEVTYSYHHSRFPQSPWQSVSHTLAWCPTGQGR